MSSALMRGRTLDPEAVKVARNNREQRLSYLKGRLSNGKITVKQRHELKKKVGHHEFFKLCESAQFK